MHWKMSGIGLYEGQIEMRMHETGLDGDYAVPLGVLPGGAVDVLSSVAMDRLATRSTLVRWFMDAPVPRRPIAASCTESPLKPFAVPLSGAGAVGDSPGLGAGLAQATTDRGWTFSASRTQAPGDMIGVSPAEPLAVARSSHRGILVAYDGLPAKV